jgi:hypothetical protein
MQRPISFIMQIAGKTAPEKRMKDKELLKIPKQVRPRPHRHQLRACAATRSLSRMPSFAANAFEPNANSIAACVHVLQRQQRAGPALPHPPRHQLHQFQVSFSAFLHH